VGAGLRCERAHIPGLYLSGGYVVRPTPPIVAVIVDIQVIAGCGRVPDVLHGRYDIELFTGRHRCDCLTGIGGLLKPDAVDCEIN
jgi:hypothetical protein